VPGIRICRSPLVVALLGVTLAGCSTDLSSFTATDLNPFKGNDPFRASDYNYFYRGEANTSGPVNAADLVGPDGRCAYAPPPVMEAGAPPPVVQEQPVAAGPPSAAPPSADPINPRSNGALYFTAGPQSGPPAGAMPPRCATDPDRAAFRWR